MGKRGKIMISIQSYVQRGRHTLRKWAVDPTAHILFRMAIHILAGFCLSAASLANGAQPLPLGLLCACRGWSAVLVGLGGSLGYLCFWGSAGYQMMVWLAAGLVVTLLLADRRLTRGAPLLLPALAGLIVAVCGVLYQATGREAAPVPVYLIRVGLAAGCTWLFTRVGQGRNPIVDWLACGFGVLALAQIVPIPYLGLGYMAAAALATGASFPAAALAGLALDLAQITPIPMTAVMALSYLVRFLPRYPATVGRLAPGAVYLVVMYLCGRADLQPLPALLIGGVAGSFLPGPVKANHRRGETGVAQVRLEMAAGVLNQTQQLLLESSEIPVDESALIARAAERACGSCPCRRNCKDTGRIGQLPGLLLHKPLLHTEELPIVCRKSGRFLAELHRSQEQLRSIHGDRQRQKEYRAALIQQYCFLENFLRDLSDQLARRTERNRDIYTPRVSVYGNRPEADNGDRCLHFAGTGGRYYVILCDGMGTGLGAVQEGRTAGMILRRLLSAGYPARHALGSINSLCALRDKAGAVTVDLAEIELDSGKVVLYKWGAPPSYLISRAGTEKIGSIGPPPGLSVTDYRETSQRFSLRREQTLLLVSDGVPEETALRCCRESADLPPEELATRLLDVSMPENQDDATVVMIRLQNGEKGISFGK